MKILTTAVDNLLRSSSLRGCLLVELDLPAATERMWSGIGTLTWNGNTFAGIGKLGHVVAAGETAELRTTETSYQMNGIIDATGLNDFISNPVRGGIAKAWLAFLDDNEQVIASPIQIDQTVIDTANVHYAASGEATLTLRGTSAVFDFRRPRGRYLTNEQLQADYPGDTGFDRIPKLANRVVSWTMT